MVILSVMTNKSVKKMTNFCALLWLLLLSTDLDPDFPNVT